MKPTRMIWGSLDYHTARLLAMLRALPTLAALEPNHVQTDRWTSSVVGHGRLAGRAGLQILEDRYVKGA